MTIDNSSYQVLLDDLIARRAKIDAAISVIQELMGIVGPGEGGQGQATVNNGRPQAVQSDSFFGMTILDAAKKYLSMMKRTKSASEITEALRDGGYTFSTDNPLNTVTSVLNRSDAKGGEVVRVSKGTFGLADWYPSRPKRKKGSEKGDAPGTDASDPETDSYGDDAIEAAEKAPHVGAANSATSPSS